MNTIPQYPALLSQLSARIRLLARCLPASHLYDPYDPPDDSPCIDTLLAAIRTLLTDVAFDLSQMDPVDEIPDPEATWHEIRDRNVHKLTKILADLYADVAPIRASLARAYAAGAAWGYMMALDLEYEALQEAEGRYS